MVIELMHKFRAPQTPVPPEHKMTRMFYLMSNTLAPEVVENRIAYIVADSPEYPVSSLVHSSCSDGDLAE